MVVVVVVVLVVVVGGWGCSGDGDGGDGGGVVRSLPFNAITTCNALQYLPISKPHFHQSERLTFLSLRLCQ